METPQLFSEISLLTVNHRGVIVRRETGFHHTVNKLWQMFYSQPPPHHCDLAVMFSHPHVLILIIPAKQVYIFRQARWRVRLGTRLSVCVRVWERDASLCHFPNHKLIKSGWRGALSLSLSKPRSNTEKLFFSRLFAFVRRLCYKKWHMASPRQERGCLCRCVCVCVWIAVLNGTDQISHSTLSCQRSAKIKGEKSPVLRHDPFSHMQKKVPRFISPVHVRSHDYS